MGDPVMKRKTALMDRLRKSLKQKRESLADEFDFKMYIEFQFKDEKKKSAMFEVEDVMAQMNNNYQLSMHRGVRNCSYSYESSKELMSKDMVQFHAQNWQSMRQDIKHSKTKVDFFLWPRNDIQRVRCHLFSKWKGEDEPWRLLDVEFSLESEEYGGYAKVLLEDKERDQIVATNEDETIFLFVNKHQVKTAQNKMTVFKLKSVCVFVPQDRLMLWKSGSVEDFIAG